MEFDDELVFFSSKIATLEIGAEVVYPPEAAALAASKQTFKNSKFIYLFSSERYTHA